MPNKTVPFEVPPIRIGRVKMRLIGDEILCVHNWSDKAKRLMLEKQMGKAQQGKEPKCPTEDFLGALHVMPGCKPLLHDEDPGSIYAVGEFGFRACGLKAAIIRAATDVGMRMTDMRRAIRIPGSILKENCFGSEALIRLHCDPGPYMRCDMVRLESGVADLRFRPEFRNWSADVLIRFNRAVITLEQVVNLVRTAGFGVGLCEWRPERGGEWGTFKVDSHIETLPDEFEETFLPTISAQENRP